MAGEIQLNSTTMATESSGSITAELDTIRPNTTNGSLVLQGDSSDAGVTGLTIDSSGVVNTTTAKVTNIQATSGQSLTIKDEDGNAAITIGTDNTAAGYLSLNFGSYHGDSGGAGSGTLSGNTLSDYETGSWTPSVGGTATYNATNYGRYVKIGDVVTVQFSLSINSLGTGSNYILSGFPFTSENINSNSSQAGCVGYYGNLANNTIFLSFYIENSATTVKFTAQSISGNTVVNGLAIFQSTTTVTGSATYRTA